MSDGETFGDGGGGGDVLMVGLGADVPAFTRDIDAAVTAFRAGVARLEEAGRDATLLDAAKVSGDARGVTTAFDGIATAIRRTAADAGLTTEAFLATIDAARSTPAGVRELNTAIGEGISLVRTLAKEVDTTNATEIASFRALVDTQRQSMLATEASVAQFGQLNAVVRQFEANVGRAADAAASESRTILRAFSGEINPLNTADVGALRELIAEQRAYAESVGISSAEVAKLAGVERELETSVTRAAAAERASLVEGTRYDSTRAESATKLVTVESELTAALRAGDATLAARISLERELAQVRRALASSTELERTAAGLERVSHSVEHAGGAAEIFGHKGQHAAIGIAFGLAELTRGGSEAESAGVRILHTVSALALAFGPEGLLVSAVASTGLAIYTVFTKTREEIEATRKKAEDELNALIDAGNIAGIRARAQSDLFGKPSAGFSDVAPGAFKGGIRDLEAQQAIELADTQRAIKAHDAALFKVAQDRIREIKTQLSPLQEDYEKAAEFLRNPALLPKLAGPIETTITAQGPRTVAQEFTALEQQVRAVADALREVERTGAVLPGLGERFFETEDRVRAVLERQSDALGTNALKLRGMLFDLDKALGTAVVVDVTLPDPTLDRLHRQLAAALDPSALVRDAQRSAAQLNPYLYDASRTARTIDNPFDLSEVTTTLAGAARPAHDLRNELQGITSGARGLLQAADAAGAIGDGARRSIDGVLSLVDSIGSLQSATTGLGKLGAGLGIAGAAISLGSGIASLFDKSQAEKDRDAALRANTDSLARLTSAFNGFNAASPASALRGVGVSRDFLTAYAQTFGKLGDRNTFNEGALTQALTANNLTRTQYVDLAKQYGFDVLDSKGRIIPDAVLALGKQLQAAAEMATKFGKSLGDVTELVTARSKIFDTDTDPTQGLRDSLEIFKTTAPKLFDGYLSGIDTTTDAGRAQLEAATRRLFDDLAHGLIPLDEFGNLTRDDVVNALLSLDSGLDALNTSATATAATFGDVNASVRGFKRAMLEFNAQDAKGASPASPLLSPSLPLPTTPFDGPQVLTGVITDAIGKGFAGAPGRDGRPATSAADALLAVLQQQGVGGTTNYNFASLIVQAAQGEDGRALLKKIIDAATIEARSAGPVAQRAVLAWPRPA